jgi:hypothetical protein
MLGAQYSVERTVQKCRCYCTTQMIGIRAAALKTAQPLLGWLIVDGETALSWSVFQKLVTLSLVRPHGRGARSLQTIPMRRCLKDPGTHSLR